ncbi:asparagine synthase (glutamine-hydrolyzing) [Salicibibacter halophilus]|uniref:asparagine synthase (glutamine-hydrolyzing) n=1 Tax=Salicibibacter halophilus TaxID=2502791 RepID=A0A514LK62_9BACI|nr:asparagine synthase (glutamine-hydrolyzing) [Salicibibacter halophilus]QDI92256.1 asparagine synthase (glutamine-hydrolyzing) [Salicibibacter halophilus]
MCGITGWLDWKCNMRNEQTQIEDMTNTLIHRGPDDQATWLHDRVAFGHTRLAVVDPRGGRQPMTLTFGKKKATIVYNGELYNTEEIRRALQKEGIQFRSHSDTEVLLNAYLVWGKACVQRINGIFAFAIWDDYQEKLFMARDRLGVKPLFFARTSTGLLFASEIKALLQHRDISATVSETGITEVMALSPSRTPGFGVFENIEELRPAHLLTFDRNGIKVRRYWQVESFERNIDPEENAAIVGDLLKDAVERQLVSDVPVGTFLSGGVDSSALTALASPHYSQERPLNTFSIDYKDNDRYFQRNDFQPDDDNVFIEEMSKTFHTEHHRKMMTVDALTESLGQAVRARDLPGMADIDGSLLWFCKEAKRKATVALSGECADEIFGGYPWFYKKELLDRPYFPWMSSLSLRQQLLNPEWQERIDVEDYARMRYQESIAETPRLEGETNEEAKRREMFYLNMIWFMTTLLDRKDRMSMAASLEVRVPFADHRLVEYVWNIPWDQKQYKGIEKGILRKALEPVLPKKVLYRKKSPYPKTHHPQYTESLVEMSKQILDDRQAPLHDIIDRTRYQALVDSKGKDIDTPFFGQLMSGPQLLAYLWQVNEWLKTYKINICG